MDYNINNLNSEYILIKPFYYYNGMLHSTLLLKSEVNQSNPSVLQHLQIVSGRLVSSLLFDQYPFYKIYNHFNTRLIINI